jgi:ABC-2 type transport system permease protein
MAHLGGAEPAGTGLNESDVSGLSRSHAGGVLGALAREQYAALATLRWRMFRNGLRSIHGILDLGAAGIALMLYSVFGLGLGFGFGAAAYGIASHASWRYLPILFWVVCFLWQVIPVMLASFQAQFDLHILLRFPVRFSSFYLMYLIFGLMDASTILGGLCCLGLWVGTTIARPDLSAAMALVLAVFAAFNILLVRVIFAWIERWLAQRKTREILGALFMVAVLSLQLLNPAIYRRSHSGRTTPQERAEDYQRSKAQLQARYEPWLKTANAIQRWLPPGLAAQSIRRAVQQQPAQGLGSLGELGLYALLAGALLAVRLRGEYRGENLGSAPSREKVAAGRSKAIVCLGPNNRAGMDHYSVDRDGGRVSSEAGPIAAVMEKEARALLRTLPLLYAIGAPLLLVVVFSSVFIRNGGAQGTVFPLALPLCMVYAQLGFTQVFYNNLGAEGAGIQLYFFSPTPIRTVLMAKNLFHSLLFGLSALVAGVLAGLRVGIPDASVVAATVAWLLFSLPCNLAAGNIVSIKMAYRVNPGRIARSAGSQGNSFFSLLVQLGFLAVGASVFWMCWYLDRMWLATPIFLALAVGAVVLWRRVLANADALANQRRDELIATLMKAA